MENNNTQINKFNGNNESKVSIKAINRSKGNSNKKAGEKTDKQLKNSEEK